MIQNSFFLHFSCSPRDRLPYHYSRVDSKITQQLSNRLFITHFSYNTQFRVTWVKTIHGNDLWDLKKKVRAISEFSIEIHTEEVEHAAKFHGTENGRGIDWEKYYDAKAEAGFGIVKKWKFPDSGEVFMQTDSLWLKPQLGYKEESVTWSARAVDFEIHGRKIEIQLFAGSNNPINVMVKTDFSEKNNLQTGMLPRKWAEQLLRKYESLGHGENFQAEIKSSDSDLIPLLNDRIGFNIKNMTILWTSHNFLFLILHEEENFV